MLSLHNVDWHVSFRQCGMAYRFSIMCIGMLFLYNVDWHVACI